MLCAASSSLAHLTVFVLAATMLDAAPATTEYMSDAAKHMRTGDCSDDSLARANALFMELIPELRQKDLRETTWTADDKFELLLEHWAKETKQLYEPSFHTPRSLKHRQKQLRLLPNNLTRFVKDAPTEESDAIGKLIGQLVDKKGRQHLIESAGHMECPLVTQGRSWFFSAGFFFSRIEN